MFLGTYLPVFLIGLSEQYLLDCKGTGTELDFLDFLPLSAPPAGCLVPTLSAPVKKESNVSKNL